MSLRAIFSGNGPKIYYTTHCHQSENGFFISLLLSIMFTGKVHINHNGKVIGDIKKVKEEITSLWKKLKK